MLKLPFNKPVRYIIEILILIVFGLYVARDWANFDETLFLTGNEPQWTTQTAVWASQRFQETGRLPQWLPYMEMGNPALDESHAFMINPFSGGPVLLFGAINGIKVSVIFYYVFAAVGGWFLAWSMGWGSAARLVCGALLALKGGMNLSFALGYFQLAAQQAYFPWSLAGAVAIVRFPNKRWPVVLLALGIALTFLAGNIYFVLPIVIITGCVALFQIVTFSRKPVRLRVNWTAVRRYVLAMGFAAGLMAVVALTILANYHLFGEHENHNANFDNVSVEKVLAQFYTPQMLFPWNTWDEYYYTYTAPMWFFLLIFVVLPPITRWLHRPANPESRRLIAACLVLILIFFLWGTGIDAFVDTLYAAIPTLGQWRVVQRMLTVVTFLIIVIIAYRLDSLTRAIVEMPPLSKGARRLIRYTLFALIFGVSGTAVYEVLVSHDAGNRLGRLSQSESRCLEWLRETYPDEQLSVWTNQNWAIFPFLDNHIRMAHVTADYDQGGLTPTIYPHDLTEQYSQYALLYHWQEDPNWWRERGYRPLSEGLAFDESGEPCFWVNDDVMPYTFAASVAYLASAGEPPLALNMLNEVQLIVREPEYILVRADTLPSDETVVVAQEIAFPGWTVQVNGEPAHLESVGQLLGVILPAGDRSYLIEFIYTAPTLKLGGAITLVTIALCILYLLRADRLPRRFKQGRAAIQASDLQAIPDDDLPAQAPLEEA
jgi:hypothetical protein